MAAFCVYRKNQAEAARIGINIGTFMGYLLEH
jgi:hypothetical protein